MKAIIIEDEAVAARRMQRLLEARDVQIGQRCSLWISI